MKRITVFCLILTAIMIFVSCGNASKNDFYGGELLDEERMSEIKSSFFTTEADETTETVEITEEIETTEEIKATETLEKNETESVSKIIAETKAQETEYNERKEDSTHSEIDGVETVFWTKNGEVWHLSRDCRYIKSSTVVSGSLEEAIEQGKSRACSSCGK